MPLQRIGAYLRNSLWFIPGLWVVGAGVLAFAMIWLDAVTPAFAADVPFIFGGGPDGARSVLGAIAGSAITVAGVTFSITIVALQLASSQFSPRVLRNFMRDRVSQMVLGSFIGAFLYSLLVLRSIRVQTDSMDEFVPSLAVSVAIAFAVVAVGMLVYFIHHISTQIQVSSIVAAIARETMDGVENEWREAGDDDGEPTAAPPGVPRRIAATRSGYLQLIDRNGLVRAATELQLVVRLDHRPGEWVQEGAPLFSTWPAAAGSEKLAQRLSDSLTLGAQRSLAQDAAYGIRQLVDVAIKALSPGINDPTSANDCIHRLTQILVATGIRNEPRQAFTDDEGRVRLILATRTFPELVGLAFDEIRHYGASTPDIVRSLATAVATVRSAVPEHRHEPLLRQLSLLRDGALAIKPAGDRERALAAIDAALIG